MTTRNRKRWNGVANAALLGALLVAAAPLGMRAWGSLTQAAARARFQPAAAPPSPRKSPAATKPNPLVTHPPHRKWQTSVLQIPAIGVDSVVDQGNEGWELMPGPGHEPRSAGAGSRGNCIIAAHRNMWEATFADLPNLKPGDDVTLTTADGIFTYRVVTSREVSVRDRAPLAPSNDAVLTLYTCVEPFHADRRWVVRARLVNAWEAQP